MAGNIFVANTTAEVNLVASSETILIRLIPPASHALKVKEWGVFFDGISVTADPIITKLFFANTSFGTGMTTHVPTRRVGNQLLSQAVVQTWGTVSSENKADSSGIVAIREVHPQSGYQEKFSYGDEPIVYQRTLVISVNSSTTVNAAAELVYEE